MGCGVSIQIIQIQISNLFYLFHQISRLVHTLHRFWSLCTFWLCFNQSRVTSDQYSVSPGWQQPGQPLLRLENNLENWLQMKNSSHPEKSGRRPRSRSDGKTTALEISIGVLCSIKTKFDFFLFHFLRWHKSETLQVRDQTIVLKSVSMQWLYSLELLLTQRIYCRSQTRLRVKAFIAELYLIETWSTWIKALFWTHGFKIF